MYKVIALVGKAGAGKDAIMNAMLKRTSKLHPIVSCTTRPMRQGEEEGKSYFFLTSEQFAEKLENGLMFEATIFNDWCYGTSIDSLSEDKINIGVYNPTGIEILSEVSDIDLFPVYIYANDKVRLIRQLNREENPDVKEVIRRYQADDEDFENLEDIDFSLTVDNNGSDTLEQLADKILQFFADNYDWAK